MKTSLYTKIFWILFAAPFIIVFLLLILISSGAFGFMPTFEELENPKNNVASEVISEDKEILGTIYIQNRSFVSYNEISPNLVNALIATEDIRYYKHSGIDFRGLTRVLFKTILLGGNTGGGSTISQQLAKNLYPRETSLVIDKLKEWITAIKLERNYTKEEILTMYLNTVAFSGQAFGIKMASKSFFNKSPDSLNIEETAVLVGMLKAPSFYNPVKNTERSKRRRNVVLSQMNNYGYLTDNQFDSLANLPLKVTYTSLDHNEGPAAYFRDYLRVTMNASKPERRMYSTYENYSRDSLEWIKNPLFGWCSKHLKPDGSRYNLYTDGLKIYTTINSKMQEYAEEAMTQHLSKNLQVDFFREKKGYHNAPFASNLESEQVQKLMDDAIKNTERYRVLHNAGASWNEIMKNFKTKVDMRVFSWNGERDTTLTPYDSIKYYKFYLQAGFMSMDPHTGYVKAYVGGPNFKHFKYDHVTVSKRQAGSTIKPFLYTLAMQEGLSPCDKVPNVAVTIPNGDTVWTPKNSGNPKYENRYVTLQWALANSVNYISAWLINQYSPQAVIDIMKKMGVTSKQAAVPSLCLGTSEITLYEMVGAYSVFANKGIYTEPIFVTKIEDKSGNVISTFTPSKVEAISEQTAYLMVNLLRGVVNYGTGYRVRSTYNLTNPIGGKTGTTQNHSDGWFMGITPNLVSGAWVGGEDRSIHFDNLALGSGSNMALPIWALYMQKVYADPTLKITKGDFPAPAEGANFDLRCPDTNKELTEDDVKGMEGE